MGKVEWKERHRQKEEWRENGRGETYKGIVTHAYTYTYIHTSNSASSIFPPFLSFIYAQLGDIILVSGIRLFSGIVLIVYCTQNFL